MKSRSRNRITKAIISFCIFLFASVYLTYPLIFHLGGYTTALSDELLIAWIHSWVVHSIASGDILSVFNANIYYPFPNTLAYSDTFFITSLLSWIPLLVIGEPIVANNVTFISSLLFLGFSIYLLCYYLTKSFFASLVAGLLVIFSPAVLDKKVHLQVLAIEFVPLALLFFIIFLNKKRSVYLLLSLLFFVLQTYNSFLPGYFILFSYLIISLVYFYENKKKAVLVFYKKNILYFIISLLLITPIALPYYQVSKEFNYTRDIRESIHLALHPEDYFYTSSDSRLMHILNELPFNQVSQNNEFKPGFIGAIFTFLAIYSIWYIIKRLRKRDLYIKSFLAIAFTGLILSLGPALHLGRQTVHEPFPIPLPYALFYYVLPGFQGFRNSARWEMLFILALAVLIAIILHNALKKVSFRKKAIIYIILVVGIIAEFNFPMQYTNVPQKKDFPEVYSWLNTTPQETKIIEFPIYVWNMHPYVFDENMREYYSTMHFRKMVNGASGFSPPPWQDLVTNLLITFPNEKSINKLKALKINYIIVHKNEYNVLYKNNYIIQNIRIKDGETIIKELSKNKSVRLIKRFEDDFVFELL